MHHYARAHMIKMWQFPLIFWTAYPFATKLGLIVHYRKPECFMEKWDCCVQGQRQSKISECQWMFFQIISSGMLNLLLPNLVWWCIIMSQAVFEKIGLLSSMSRSNWQNIIISKIWLSNISSELLIFLQLNLVWWHIIISWIVLWKDWIALLWSRSQEIFWISVNVHLHEIFSNAEPFVAKLGMVIHHCGPESFCILYLLYHWSLGSQTRCADVLLLITKPSATKLAYADSNTLTYSITRHAMRVGMGMGYFVFKATNLVAFGPVATKTLPVGLVHKWGKETVKLCSLFHHRTWKSWIKKQNKSRHLLH